MNLDAVRFHTQLIRLYVFRQRILLNHLRAPAVVAPHRQRQELADLLRLVKLDPLLREPIDQQLVAIIR